MKVRIHRWKNRDDTFSTPNITGVFNGEGPVEIEDVDFEEKDAEELLENPTKWKVKKEKDKYKMIKK